MFWLFDWKAFYSTSLWIRVRFWRAWFWFSFYEIYTLLVFFFWIWIFVQVYYLLCGCVRCTFHMWFIFTLSILWHICRAHDLWPFCLLMLACTKFSGLPCFACMLQTLVRLVLFWFWSNFPHCLFFFFPWEVGIEMHN